MIRQATERGLSLVAFAGLLVACSGEPPRAPANAPSPPAVGNPAPLASPRAAVIPAPGGEPAAPPLVVFLGDSLTAGLGLGEGEAYPALVGELLAARGIAARVVNAGVSGDTTAGGLARLDWLLAQRPALLLVALGANDGLRGQPLAAIEANLRAIVERSRAAGVPVLLAGMQMPPNYGPEYTRGFRELYPRLARELAVPIIPFLLDGVAAVPELNQADGIHPTAKGHRRMAELVVDPVARELARRVSASP